jgi:thiamine pyrophosphate-dependent acetolactate synthase large subunit-like protein
MSTVAETLGRVLADLPPPAPAAAFGLVGSGNFVLIEELRAGGVKYYGTRHECAAVAAAEAYARVSGRLGVATVHQGPGLTNALTAVTEAARSRTPVLVLAGDTGTLAQHANQNIDQDGVAESVGAIAARVRSAGTAVEDLLRAMRRALEERCAVVLSLPVDVQELTCTVPDGGVYAGPPARAGAPAPDALAAAAERCATARRPVIVAGRGAVLAGARAPLEALGERIGALFATSAAAKGLFAGNPFDLGVCGGFASALAARLLSQADLVLAFGASLNHWTTRRGEVIARDVAVVHCDVEPAAIGARHPASVGLAGDAALGADGLLAELERRRLRSEGYRSAQVLEELAAYDRAGEFHDESGPDGIDPRTLHVALDHMLPAERTVVVDCGHFMGWAPMYMRVPDPAGFVFAQAFQSVGLGLGGAVGAAAARPDRVCVAVVGDGGTFMTLGELETLVRHRLPVLVVVVDDRAYGAEVHHFEHLGRDPSLAAFPDVDLAAVARALGMDALTVRRVEELEGIARWLQRRDGPLLVDAKVNPAVRAEWLEEAFRAGA